MREMRKIVVGTDGSPSSVEAVRWALREARQSGAQVHLVHAWTYPYSGVGYGITPAMDPDELEKTHRHVLDETLAHFQPEEMTGIEIITAVVHDQAAEALLDAALDADLLVVGSRGRGTIRSVLLGSTSHSVLQHAHCPVLVVKGVATDS